MDPQESAFLDAIRCQPDDDSTRLVYADWLEEQCDYEDLVKSTFLRLQYELSDITENTEASREKKRRFNEIAKKVPTAWLRLVGKMPIENCAFSVSLPCPKQWGNLEQLNEYDWDRHCSVCQQNVHFCVSLYHAQNHVLAGLPVAVQPGEPRSNGDLDPENIPVDPLWPELDKWEKECMMEGLDGLQCEHEESTRSRRRGRRGPGGQ